MQNTKRLSELLAVPGKRLASLKQRAGARTSMLSQVKATLSPKLAEVVTSAGLEQGQLTVGVISAVWASRLRYSTEAIRKRVALSSGLDIHRVRIRVLPQT